MASDPDPRPARPQKLEEELSRVDRKRLFRRPSYRIAERGEVMFSVQQKHEIADAVQKILRETNHPELPTGEIYFDLHVFGAEAWSWADIQNNSTVKNPKVNPWNEHQAKK